MVSISFKGFPQLIVNDNMLLCFIVYINFL
nr:MAG TPA: hypothetical protein [Caudoviricetes sp.]